MKSVNHKLHKHIHYKSALIILVATLMLITSTFTSTLFLLPPNENAVYDSKKYVMPNIDSEFLITNTAPKKVLNRTVIQADGLDYGKGIAVDSSGNIYITGYTDSFGAGKYDAFIVKYGPDGNKRWEHTWGGVNNDYGLQLAIDSSDNIYVTGHTYSFGAGVCDVFIVKYDSEGNKQWEYTWGGAKSDYGVRIAIDSSDNIYVTGHTNSFISGTFDVFVLKYNPEGNKQWEYIWSDSNNDNYGWGIITDNAGNIYVAGIIKSHSSTSSSDIFLLSMNDNEIVAEVTFGNVGDDYAKAIAIQHNSTLIMVYWYSSDGDTYITAYNYTDSRTFSRVWQISYGGLNIDEGGDVYVNTNNVIYITGTSCFGDNYFGLSDCDVFLAVYSGDTDGDGLSDFEELKYGTNSFSSDTDTDNLTDYYEINHNLNPLDPDTDADQLKDGEEFVLNTDPLNNDTDGDGLIDGDEVNIYNTDPLSADTDGDGMPDGWEVPYGLNATDASDKYKDADNDGLNNYQEYLYNGNPDVNDTDGDGLLDYEEMKAGANISNPDTDGDGINDGVDQFPTINNWVIFGLSGMVVSIIVIISITLKKKSKTQKKKQKRLHR